MLANTLPVGTTYQSTYFGGVVKSEHEAKLIYRWGKKGECGMESQPIYYIPILEGHVGEYVTPDKVQAEHD